MFVRWNQTLDTASCSPEYLEGGFTKTSLNTVNSPVLHNKDLTNPALGEVEAILSRYLSVLRNEAKGLRVISFLQLSEVLVELFSRSL